MIKTPLSKASGPSAALSFPSFSAKHPIRWPCSGWLFQGATDAFTSHPLSDTITGHRPSTIATTVAAAPTTPFLVSARLCVPLVFVTSLQWLFSERGMMLPSTVRRIAAAAPQSPLLASLASTATRSTAALTLNSNPQCCQRRRYSSSKPSSPNDSPKGYAAGQVTASPAQSTKQSGEKRKRKAKDSSIQRKLPSVPSTQDVPQEAFALATFFSLHRPISVTHSFPKAITDDAFAQIFAQRTKSTAYNSNRVVSTLARSVDQLEQPMQGLSMASQQVTDTSASHDMNGEPVQQISVKHADGTETSVYVQLDHMSGQFLPFNPPPIPQPLSGSEADAEAGSANAGLAQSEGTALQQEPQTRIYKAMFTLEETIDENGNSHIKAHTPQVIEDDASDASFGTLDPPRSFLERMALREIRRENVRGRAKGMLAISVKRQRKLKMKKKKYKKLMRRTRNERRKLDRV
ncbi:hypothetical protein F4678DRAFT_480256 [Xylaria arbuscula]|nr:hypothetical protein F4678DRAFT_480256 [Xylaria arbuscula]